MAKTQSPMERLEALRARDMNLSLDTITALLEALGNPHESLDVIHVSGTNGKGAVVAYASQILCEAGHKVGTYSSPHVHTVTERIRVDCADVSEKVFEQLVMEVLDAADEAGLEPTYFEALTAMAFKHFADEDVDYAVVEVGLGGRLDSTNVFREPLVTIITNVGIEHAQQLGSTDEAIAREKAGILRKGVPVLTGAEGLALKAVWSEAAKVRAPLKVLRSLGRPEVVKSDLGGVTFTLPGSSYGKLHTQLPGDHNAANAALAIHALQLLGEKGLELPAKAVVNGIANTFLPARLQVLRTEPAFIVDGAHNPDAVKTLRNYIQRLEFERIYILFGVLRDKDYGAMTEIMAPISQEVFVTQPPGSGDRGLNAKALAGEAKRYCSRVRTVRDLPTALKTLLGTAGPKDAIVCFGSFYLAGAVIETAREMIE